MALLMILSTMSAFPLASSSCAAVIQMLASAGSALRALFSTCVWEGDKQCLTG